MSEPKRGGVSTVVLVLFRIVFTFFAVYSVVFIFQNSLEIGSVSSAHSAEVTKLLNKYVTALGLSPLSEALVRKLAHFGEFAASGLWFTLCLRVYTKHLFRHISWPLLIGLLIANADEMIQSFVSGRSSSVRDVWIDFSGVCSGVLAALLVLGLLGSVWYLLGFGSHKKMS